MKNPYGQAYFAGLRAGQYFYADKTPFIPRLEGIGSSVTNKYVLFLRPRRMGKSLLVSMLEHYYDLAHGDRFDEIFGGLWIHRRRTPEQGSHLVLHLDFSPVTTDSSAPVMHRSFTALVKNGVRAFLTRYAARFRPLARFLETSFEDHEDAATLMGTLLSIVAGLEHKLYLLIDEYDNFANRLLADGEQALYDSIVGSTGFVRSFYAALKAGTATGALARMFVTGVSPIMLDDLSSGFNIIEHISLEPRFDALVGFTRAEVEQATADFLAERPHLRGDPKLGDRERLLSAMEVYYNGYRFSVDATERVYNTSLVLYFFSQIDKYGRFPRQMLDMNVRTDYGRIRRIARISGSDGGELRDLLEAILTKDKITSQLVEQFGSRTMYSREQLVSLFYYMGMLTFGPSSPEVGPAELVIPNRVMRELQWEYLAFSLRDHERIGLDTMELPEALSAMAVKGDIEPLLAQFRRHVVKRLGSKDLRQFSEKVLKLMLLAYISQSRVFHILSEKEFSGGYCDLFLALSEAFPAGKFAWMLEVKYLKTGATAAAVEKAVEEAHRQLERYASDEQLVSLLTLGKKLEAGALVFVGAKDVLFRPWPPEARLRKVTAGQGVTKKAAAVRKVVAAKKAVAARKVMTAKKATARQGARARA